MKGSIEAIPTYLYVIIGLVVGVMMLLMISKYSGVFKNEEKDIVIDGNEEEISESLIKIIYQCWKEHRRGLDDKSSVCKEVKFENQLKIEEKDLNEFLDCDILPNVNCYPDVCESCSSNYFDDNDKVIWFAEPENTEIKISYSGYSRKIVIVGFLCDSFCMCINECKEFCFNNEQICRDSDYFSECKYDCEHPTTTTTSITTTTIPTTTTTLSDIISLLGHNPGQGIFQCHSTDAIGADYVKGGSIIIKWGEFQPDGPDSLSQEAVDKLVSEIKRTNKKVYLHFMIYTGEDGKIFPPWLNLGDGDDEPFKITAYYIDPDALTKAKQTDKIELIYLVNKNEHPFTYYNVYPKPWGENYNRELENFLTLFNQALEENGVKNRVEYIEPAVGGIWGTTHLWMRNEDELGVWIQEAGCSASDYSCLGSKFSEGVDEIIDIYLRSFPNMPIMVIGGSCGAGNVAHTGCNYNGFSNVLNKYGMRVMYKNAGLGARSVDCGFRDYVFNPICGNNAKTKCGQEPTGQSIVCGSQWDFFNPNDPCGKDYNQVFKESVAKEKISYYCIYGGDLKCGANQATNKYVADHLGSQIELVNFDFNSGIEVEIGETLTINFNWKNTGTTALIAPLKNGQKWEASSYKLFLEFEKDGGIVHYQEFDIDPPTNTWTTTNLLYQTSSSTIFNIPENLGNNGIDTTYKLYVGFTDPNGERIRFGLNNINNNDLENKRYLLTDSFVVNGD